MLSRDGTSFYVYTNSPIHKLNYRYKIISMLMIFAMILLCNSWIDYLVVNIFLFVMMIWSDISIRLYFKYVFLFRFVIVLLFGVISFFSLNVFLGFGWALKFMDIVIYFSIITMTTTFNDVIFGIELFFSPFKRFFSVSKLALNIGIFVKLLAIMYGEDARIKRSKKLRGVRFRDQGLVDRIDSFINNIGPLYRISMKKVDVIQKNMYIRNYGSSISRNNYRLNNWKKTDTMLLVMNILMFLVIMIY